MTDRAAFEAYFSKRWPPGVATTGAKIGAWDAWQEAVRLERERQETDRDWSQAQDWKGMDGATAWLLINRHADGWGDTRAMMEAWLAANAKEYIRARSSQL